MYLYVCMYIVKCTSEKNILKKKKKSDRQDSEILDLKIESSTGILLLPNKVINKKNKTKNILRKTPHEKKNKTILDILVSVWMMSNL